MCGSLLTHVMCLGGVVAHFSPVTPLSLIQIPLAEMEALSLLSEKSWSLALTDDSLPDEFNPLLLTSLEYNVFNHNDIMNKTSTFFSCAAFFS